MQLAIKEENRKVYDSIYGFISFPKEIWQFIDTPQFQRLRNIKQLGCLSWVFPGAVHTRFEHSLGTGHLAQLFIKTLINRHNQAKRQINKQVYQEYYIKKDQVYKSNIDTAIFTVTLAGILHDIGHGPFSHLFDSKVISKINGSGWEHQIASIHLIQSIYKQILQNKTNKEEIEWLSGTKNRVKALVIGKIQKLQYIESGNVLVKGKYKQEENLSIEFRQQFKKQIKTRPWQFQIVSNRLTGIDVDKLDYFRRDAHYMGAKNIYIDHQLLINEALILPTPNTMLDDTWQLKSKKNRICFPSKYADKVYDVFYSRYKLYKTYYFNLKANGVDFMIAQILKNVKKQFKLEQACIQLIKGQYQKYIRLTDSILERVQDAYDNIISKIPQEIKNTSDSYQQIIQKIPLSFRADNDNYKEVIKAGQILKMLKRRQIYQFIKEYHKSYSDICAFEKVRKQIKQKWIKPQKYRNLGFIIQMVEIGFGVKDENVFQQCKFYDKSLGNKQILKSNQTLFSMLKPKDIMEISIRIYYEKRIKQPSQDTLKQLQNMKKKIYDELYEIDKQFVEGNSGTFTVRGPARRNTNFDKSKIMGDQKI